MSDLQLILTWYKILFFLVCNLNKRKYEDGAETVVECNAWWENDIYISYIYNLFSVCACGKWICTSNKCPEKHSQDLSHIEDFSNAVDDYDEEDSEEFYDDDDEEDPEDDPDVSDINWF